MLETFLLKRTIEKSQIFKVYVFYKKYITFAEKLSSMIKKIKKNNFCRVDG